MTEWHNVSSNRKATKALPVSSPAVSLAAEELFQKAFYQIQNKKANNATKKQNETNTKNPKHNNKKPTNQNQTHNSPTPNPKSPKPKNPTTPASQVTHTRYISLLLKKMQPISVENDKKWLFR